MSVAVVTDFDGTVTREDVSELILQEYTGDAWRVLEDRFARREIGGRECVAGQFALVDATRADLIDFVERRAQPDPHFSAFLAFTRTNDIPVEVASEGLDFYVDHLLRRWGFDVPWRATRTHFNGGGITLSYPFEDATCRLCGTCKMAAVLRQKAAGRRVVYIGDGHSDICPALEAHLVFAKRHLAEECRREGVDFVPFRDFDDVLEALSGGREPE